MNPLRRITRPLRSLFGKGRLEREMAEEMRFHLEQRAADLRDDGLSSDEARYAAQRKFGNVASLQEQARAGRGWTWLENLVLDLHLGVRSLRKSPGFALLAISTLALGIGVNTSMFSAFNDLMLKPLPYADTEQLDRIDRVTAQNPQGRISPADFLDFQREAGGYGEIAAYALGDTSLSAPGQPAEMARAARATVSLFGTLGVKPQLGRDFRPGEDIHGNDRVLILSQRTWQNRFGGRTDIIGHTIRVDGEPHEIIGVLPAAFNDWRHLGGIDFFRPLAFDRSQAADRHDPMLRLIGRRPGKATLTGAAAFVANFGARQAKDYPGENAGSTWRLIPLNETVLDSNGRVMMAMLIGLSGFVLLIGCSNLANLLLARTIARAREFAVRSALGASRLQLLRPLVAESLLLALAGGGGALLVARWAMDYLSVRSTADNGERVHFYLDGHVLLWAFAASLATALAFGLAPALFAMRLDLNNTLKSGARGATGGRGQQRFRQFLIVGQFALAMILLTGAALFIRGLAELNNRRAGWESEHLVTGTVVLPAAGYPDADRITAFYRLAVERLEALPGVISASISAAPPFYNWSESRRYLVEGREPPEWGHEPAAVVNSVSSRYFETVGTRLVAGRAFNGRDTADSAKVFVINHAMAAGLFGSDNPIGRRLAQAGRGSLQWGEIVGVVADVRSVNPEPALQSYQLYQPIVQEPRPHVEIAVRVAGGTAASLIDSVRATMSGLDPDLPVRALQTADVRIYRANYQLGVLRDMLGSFAVLGLGLASLGIYGVIARTMAQRTGEFAIRLALGAGMRDITRIVLVSGVKLALMGSALGLCGAVAVSRFIASSYPGMHFGMLPVLIGTMAVLIAVALIACWLPARRAGRVNPIEALRAE